jgi:hypothetical protein
LIDLLTEFLPEKNMNKDKKQPALAGQVERLVRPRLTKWFPRPLKPSRAGMYRMQDNSMNCGCCWFDAHWNGREWHTDLFNSGIFNVLLPHGHVNRWRGLAQRHNAMYTAKPIATPQT